MNRHERRAAARSSKTKSAAAPNGADARRLIGLRETALQHMRAGRLMQARLCCHEILSLDAGHVDTLQLLGLLSLQDRQYDDAIEWIARADRQDPKAGHLSSLGTVLEQQGLHEQALKAIERAVKQMPDDAGLWTRLADLLVLLQRPAQAIAGFEQALKQNPSYWFAAHNCALLLHKLQRYEEALAKLNQCEALRPDHAPTMLARASTLYGLNRFEDALAEGKRAQALDPANAEVCFNVGAAMQKLAQHADALEQFDRALALRPDFLAALHNSAFTLTELQRFDEALQVYRRIKQIDPDNADADWNAALIQLRGGDFNAGWRGREARWKMPSLPATAAYPTFPQPMWRGGETLEGKTILVCADEGLGDTIQFVRYVPMLAALGARVILLPQEPLYPLLSGLAGLSQCLPNMHGGLPAFDFHCPITSLPMAFETTLGTIPASTSYLPRPTDARMRAYEERLGARDQMRIGLVWSGNSKHWNDHNRSMPFAALSRVIVAGAAFVSLQKDAKPADTAALRERTDIIDLSGHLTDFNETAALIGCLDLVITVDTSVAHLAAALGCPTWILLPSVPDWRWLLDRDDSPWYPTVRLFRQTTAGNYDGVLDDVRTQLLQLVAAGASSRKEPGPPAVDARPAT